MGHAVVTLSMYVALLLKVDVSGERPESQHLFEGVLIAAHICMGLVIMVETAAQGVQVWLEKRAQNPSSRFKTEGNPFSNDLYKVEKQHQRRVEVVEDSSSSPEESSPRTKEEVAAPPAGGRYLM